MNAVKIHTIAVPMLIVGTPWVAMIVPANMAMKVTGTHAQVHYYYHYYFVFLITLVQMLMSAAHRTFVAPILSV